MTVTIFFDGLVEPMNPGGIAAYGYVIRRDGVPIKKGARVIGEGPGMTNNVAEYAALHRALEWCVDNNIVDTIKVYGDSQLVIRQLNGIYAIRSATSQHWVPKVQEKIRALKGTVSFSWIPREQNEEADMLSRTAYRRYCTKKEMKQ